MTILAFDTCMGDLSVAVARVGGAGVRIIVEHHEAVAGAHAERLVPLVAATMREAGIGFGDLSRIAVTLGPGTFTGVRTGIAAARAFRLAAQVPIVGTTSLAVLAQRVLDEQSAPGTRRPVLIAADARRGRHYVQLFGSSALEPASEPRELTAPEAAMLLPAQALLAGSGAEAVANVARDMGKQLETRLNIKDPRASDLARLAPHLEPLDIVMPLYIRPPDAKPQAGKSIARAP